MRPALTRHLVRTADVAGYHPANHAGTTTRRRVSPDTGGATRLEVVHGTIERGRGALPHAHPDMEQVCYLLDGRALVEVGGERFEAGPGDAVFFPAGVPHALAAVSVEPVKLLVIYAPPYGEDPAKVAR